jgi:signal peptidase I
MRALFFAFLFGLFLRNFFLIVTTTGPSMAETLPENSVCIINKMVNINRGDMISFKEPVKEEPLMVIKRVIAKPGDTIFVKDGNVFLKTDAKLDATIVKVGNEKYYLNPFREKADLEKIPEYAKCNINSKPITLKNNEYFVLGDNRELAMDSRFYGPVGFDLVEGKVFKIL